MRIRFEEGSVEAIPGEGDRRIIDSYMLLPVSRPVKPKLSSSVLLVRNAQVPAEGERNSSYKVGGIDPDGNQAPSRFPKDFPNAQNVEVFMLRRAKTMAFAPNAVVFPGGSVDKRDATPSLPWFGPSPAHWAEYMSCSEEDARLAIVAAAREVFEESGVLLAGPDGQTTATTSENPEKWSDLRNRLANHELSFAEVLIENNLMLRSDLLGLVANLQTPQNEPRRYDTFFFSALMPEGQKADGNTSEAVIADWVTPARAVLEGDAGNWKVMPPTLINLSRLSEAQDAASFVQTRRKVDKVSFHLEYEDELGECPYLSWKKTDILVGCRSDFDSDGNYLAPQGFIKDVEPWQGGWVHSRIYCHRNNNPSPMTYVGTNTWIVLGPSPEFKAEDSFAAAARYQRKCVIIDPGVVEEVPAIIAWCKDRNLEIGAVLSTHYHADHTSGAVMLAQQLACPYFAWGSSFTEEVKQKNPALKLVNLQEGTLEPGKSENWNSGLPCLRLVHTPGHTPDSVCFVVEGSMHAITGDLLFSQGPTILKEPDGNLGDYLESLDKVQHLIRDAKAKVFLPGHGYPISQCFRIINATRDHRNQRLSEIKAALEAGVESTPEAIVDFVYKETPESLRPAALKSAAFQLKYLGF